MRKRENKQNHRPILRRFTTWLHGAGAKCALIYAVGTLVLLVLFAAACAQDQQHQRADEIGRAHV